jgi:hypothetical protein
LLLIDRGTSIMDGVYLDVPAAEGVREFLVVALALATRGATGSMSDPVAVI